MATATLIAAVFGAGIIQGFLGFGAGIFAMSVLAATHGLVHAAGIVNGTSIALAAGLCWLLRHHVQWRAILPVIPSAFGGVVIGVLTLDAFDATLMTRVLGATIIGLSVYYLLRPEGPGGGPRGKGWAAGAGLLSGTLSGAMNVGGPPIVAWFYSRPDPPEANKANVQVVFLSMGLLRLAVAAGQGMITRGVWVDMLIAAPSLLTGLVLGLAGSRRLSPAAFRRVSWIAFACLGAWLIVRS